ncbi:MAG TPA: hypothetical protein VF744_21030 [Beijerinckiaceae bacterium]
MPMWRRLIVALALANLALAGAPLAPAAAETLPKEIQDELEAYRASCREIESDLADAEKAIRRIDLDGDGRPDFVVHMDESRCASGHTPYCTTGGCALTFYLATPKGVARIFDGVAWSYEVLGEGKRRSIRLRMHGGYCGLGGAEECFRTHRITGRSFDFKQWCCARR